MKVSRDPTTVRGELLHTVKSDPPRVGSPETVFLVSHWGVGFVEFGRCRFTVEKEMIIITKNQKGLFHRMFAAWIMRDLRLEKISVEPPTAFNVFVTNAQLVCLGGLMAICFSLQSFPACDLCPHCNRTVVETGFTTVSHSCIDICPLVAVSHLNRDLFVLLSFVLAGLLVNRL